MEAHVTKNGVRIIFSNNVIKGKPGAPPLFVTDDEGNLTEVNFVGYEIRPIGEALED